MKDCELYFKFPCSGVFYFSHSGKFDIYQIVADKDLLIVVPFDEVNKIFFKFYDENQIKSMISES